MVVGLYSELRKILIKNGCRFIRQGKGSHEIWESPVTKARFSVPVTIKSNGTFKAILKQAGITQK